jgi:hypothetical protein
MELLSKRMELNAQALAYQFSAIESKNYQSKTGKGTGDEKRLFTPLV